MSGTRTSPIKRSRRRRPSHGGAQSCKVCKQIASYGIKCSSCNRLYHDGCILSLEKKSKRICASCFHRSNIEPSLLDSHMHAPFSPENKVMFHPYTYKFADANDMLDRESGEEFLPSASGDEEEEHPPAKRRLAMDTPPSKRSRASIAAPAPTAAQAPAPAPTATQPPAPAPSVAQPTAPAPSVAQPTAPVPSVAQTPAPAPSVAQTPAPAPSVAQPPAPAR